MNTRHDSSFRPYSWRSHLCKSLSWFAGYWPPAPNEANAATASAGSPSLKLARASSAICAMLERPLPIIPKLQSFIVSTMLLCFCGFAVQRLMNSIAVSDWSICSKLRFRTFLGSWLSSRQRISYPLWRSLGNKGSYAL